MLSSFKDRADACDNLVAKQLFEIMEAKQSMLCLSADIEDKKQFLALTDKLGDKLVLLKTHIDIIKDFDEKFIKKIQALAKKHNFLIFEDRKFADIGNTVKKQYSSGIYKIAEWAHIVNAHPLPGPGIIEGLKAVGLPKGRALLLLAQMSSKENLIDENYSEQTAQFAKEHRDFVIGFITQKRLLKDKTMLHMAPGIKLKEEADALGQMYHTPESVVKSGADIIIVGRGIIEAEDPIATAETYRKRAWDAYQALLRTD